MRKRVRKRRLQVQTREWCGELLQLVEQRNLQGFMEHLDEVEPFRVLPILASHEGDNPYAPTAFHALVGTAPTPFLRRLFQYIGNSINLQTVSLLNLRLRCSQNQLSLSPLESAVMQGNVASAVVMVEAGATISNTVLRTAFLTRNNEMINFLVCSMPSPQATTVGVISEHAAHTNCLAKCGHLPKLQQFITAPRQTLVRRAATQGNTEGVRQLLRHKANPNQAALHMARTGEVAQLLLQAKADVNERSVTFRQTPIQYAVRHARDDVVKVLLDHKADATHVLMCDAHTPSVVQQLLACKVQVTEQCFRRYVDPECPAIDNFADEDTEVNTIHCLFHGARRQPKDNPWKRPLAVLRSGKASNKWKQLPPEVIQTYVAPFIWEPPTLLSQECMDLAERQVAEGKVGATATRVRDAFLRLRNSHTPADVGLGRRMTNHAPSEIPEVAGSARLKRARHDQEEGR